MASFRKSSAVKLPGFSFGVGPIFSQDMETSTRIYAALIGEDLSNLTLEDALGRAQRSVQTLFETALHYEDLYRALRGGFDYWDVIRSNAALHYDLSADDVKLMTTTMVNARIAHGAAPSPTHINTLVDRFNHLQKQTAVIGPAHTFNVTVHPAAAAQHAVNGLEANLRAMNITGAWPPADFDQKDMVILANKDVMSVLGGVNPNSVAPRQPYVTANSRNLPALIRVQLCHLALTQYRADKDWVLFLSPVGFLNDTYCRKWHTVAGQQTKVFATAKQFLAYSYDALTRRNKDFAIGMFTHWLLQSSAVAKVANLVRNDPAEVWTDREMMRRYATVIIIRRIPAGKRMQVIFYDPSFHDGTVKKQFGHSQLAITNYRQQVMGGVKEWAGENEIVMDSRYYGGPVSKDVSVAGDGVKQCFAFLEGLVSGQDVGHALPAAEDQTAFEGL